MQPKVEFFQIPDYTDQWEARNMEEKLPDEKSASGGVGCSRIPDCRRSKFQMLLVGCMYCTIEFLIPEKIVTRFNWITVVSRKLRQVGGQGYDTISKRVQLRSSVSLHV